MERCSKCKLWFPTGELDGPAFEQETWCIHCDQTWKEHPERPPGLDFPDGPPSYFDLLEKLEVRETRYEVVLPFAHQPESSYVEATVYEGPGRYWHIEERSGKFKDAHEAILEVVKTADARRTKMLNDEFEKEFGEIKPGGSADGPTDPPPAL